MTLLFPQRKLVDKSSINTPVQSKSILGESTKALDIHPFGRPRETGVSKPLSPQAFYGLASGGEAFFASENE
jgi:hypothetical protein